MLLGFIISAKIPAIADRDLEVHAVAALLHDIGWDPTGELVSEDKRFEVDGANAARDFLHREVPHWDKHRLLLSSEDGAEFLDLGAVIRALDDWAVKDKFCFWTKKRDVDGATGNLAGWLAGIITETTANYIS
ncbi:hypothetical protein VC83_03597 [Pseudogymnoascus destructans]|uniref:HD domain-containing protein n=1 Tax=Pseudogymnoascus destructans TaxID=655981 RepID=A0A177AEB1_9PEZI|nr:uncharacterized protein VC83_03597 [Pseudogymnoascus destructans]OAF60449.1 hypothetical protein VC83_03597 [Pseudogymnoascus destructans]